MDDDYEDYLISLLWEEEPEPESEPVRDGTWCVVCGRYICADVNGLMVHDPVPHPITMLIYNDDEIMH